MKQLFILFAMPGFLFGQQMVNIWKITPTVVCPGDTVKVHYKFNTPSSSVHDFATTSPYNLLASYSNASLQAQPQELVGTDMCYFIKFPMANLAPGNYTMMTNPSTNSKFPFTVNNCSCSITAAISYTANYLKVDFEDASIGSNSATARYWDIETTGWNAGTSTVSWTFSTPGTYTVGLLVVNPTCQDDTMMVINVEAEPVDTVGIKEYQKDLVKPVYFDLYGNQTEYKKGLLIEQVGQRRRKILVQ